MKRGFCLWALLLLAAFSLAGCGGAGSREARGAPTVVSDLAYDAKADACQRVYLAEDGVYAPFLVLENRGGGTLLLREFALDAPMRYGEAGGAESAYYGESDVDRFLNGDYLKRLDAPVDALLLASQVEVTAREGLRLCEDRTESLTRKVFLLSATETCTEPGAICAIEGNALAYFRKADRKRVTHADGTPATWYTRTPALSVESAVLAVNGDGVTGICPLASAAGDSLCALRPALRVRGNAKLETLETDGGTVYILSGDYESEES